MSVRPLSAPLLLAALAWSRLVSAQAEAPAPNTEAASPSADSAPSAEPAPAAPAPSVGAAAAGEATPDATASPASTALDASTSSDDAGAAAQLDEEQPGATDALLSGEALKIYGFGDVGFRQMLVPKSSPWLTYFNRHPSLFVGHLNLYFDSQLAERWRALAEVRFTYLPQGSWKPDDHGNFTHYDYRGADYTDFTRDRTIGSVMIERAFIEYSATSWLSVQAGHFLTPYGVWNIDHGSPVIIGVTAPFLVGARLLPESQVGLLAQGRVSLVDDLELSYALGVSNGRADVLAYEDLDSNKALTARLALTYRGAGELTLGSTFYTGKTSENTRALYFEDGAPKSREDIVYQLTERSYAFDLRWVWQDLQVQAEAIVSDRKYTERGRPPHDDGLEPDQRLAGGYGLIGYRTPFFGVMPYVKGEYSPDPALRFIGITDNPILGTVGLNYRPVPRVVCKAEYNHAFFPNAEPGTFADNDIAALDLQIAWAF